MESNIKVYWATRLRGFLKNVSISLDDVEFENDGYYETNSLKSNVLSKLIRSSILNPFGVFKRVSISGKDCDIYGSFNRFLECDKPYFLYLENPTALYHYTIGRISFPKGRERFRKCINDNNLKYIMCMSDACRNSFEQLNGPLSENVKIETVYPLVKNNKHCSEEIIKEKSYRDKLKLLYCVQGIRFVSKGGLEVLYAFRELRKTYSNISLKIITKISDLDTKVLKIIKETDGVSLHDFTYSYDELESIYADTNILLQPASDESFGLTVLEAMKGGCALIVSKMYAFPEMVEDGENGYLIDPKYWFFDENNMPNKSVWNNRKKTIYSLDVSKRMTEELIARVENLHKNRELLEYMCKSSYLCSIDDERFGENGIRDKWERILNSICEEV